MSAQIRHKGDRSWWDGSVKTLCGLKLPAAERVWFPSWSSTPLCATCKALDKK